METADPSFQLNAQSSDRLSFGFFIAAVLHAALIFGIVVKEIDLSSSIADLDITLVTHFAEKQPVDADFWAQANQQASGTKEDALMPTTRSTDATDGVAEGEGVELQQTKLAAENPGEQIVSTSATAQDVEKIDLTADQNQQTFAAEAMARREAKLARLDVLQQDYARRPKIGTLTSVSAKARDDAQYQLHLQERITEIGNTNYPEGSLSEGIFGSLRMMMSILPDGTLESVEILEPSGHLMLDKAALEIARLSAPFQGFSGSTASQYDKIAFIRTWHFLPNGSLETRSD